MDVAIIGTGYVGLVTGACLAEARHNVTCVDKDFNKIEMLQQGKIPIHEPGLEELIKKNPAKECLHFTTDIQAAIEQNSIIFICVGTPQGDDGRADLTALWDVVDEIKKFAKSSKHVVIKSTVPVGTNAKVNTVLKCHQVISNPEFLREGSAVYDCMNPGRVVIGTRTPQDVDWLKALYGGTLLYEGIVPGKGHCDVTTKFKCIVMSPESAELTKYASNSFLATKISYMNEIANLCEHVGANIDEVKLGMTHDDRISHKFLNAGCGYGGSCFPKDVRALIRMANDHSVTLKIPCATEEINKQQKRVLVDKLLYSFGGDVQGKTIAIWGLAFKPGTDDIREAPALVTIGRLVDQGAIIKIHDPQASSNCRKKIPPDWARFYEDKMDAVEGADALLILTEWDEYKDADTEKVKELMKCPMIFDGRNIFDLDKVEGFFYDSIGRPIQGANNV